MPDFVDPMLRPSSRRPLTIPTGFRDQMGRLPGRGRGGGGGAAVDPWPQGRRGYFGPFLDAADVDLCPEAIVDGEVVAFGAHGEPDFALLQGADPATSDVRRPARSSMRSSISSGSTGARSRRAPGGSQGACCGVSCARIRGCASPTTSRPRARVLRGGEGPRPRGHHGQGTPMPYLPGLRSSAWQKVKIRPEQELVVGGWNAGRAPRPIWARSTWASTRATRCATRARSAPGSRRRPGGAPDALATLTTDVPPFSHPRRGGPQGITWVEPSLVIRAEFAGWTGDGLVRQASYKGLDRGKDPRLVVREVPGADRI